MKKIAIITIFDENNYGNRLQNYATQEVLKELGFEVETINNVNIIKNRDYFDRLKNIMPERIEKFKKFNEENMNIYSEIIFHDKIPKDFHKNYDYFVIGSDQIWNYKFEDRFSDFSFARFAPKEKRISFSASLGVSKVPKNEHIKYEALKEMKAISVREDAGKTIVEQITERKDCKVLIDPTMMLSAEKWNTIIKKPKKLKSNKYIFKYFLGKVSKEINEKIEKFAEENNCEIVDVLDEKTFYNSGPSEFVYLIKNSFIVFTDSFHSCVFSIIFNKPFLVFDREENLDIVKDMNSRIETLLEKFELEDRKFKDEITSNDLNINYINTYNLLKKEQEKVILYLKMALEIREDNREILGEVK